MRSALLLALALAFAPTAAADPPRWQTLPLPPAMPDATSHGTVSVGGAEIYYAIYGSDAGSSSAGSNAGGSSAGSNAGGSSAGSNAGGSAVASDAPVILLHGGLGNGEHWSNQVPALARRYRVIAIDSRGQGRSTRTRAPISYSVMADDVIAVMDQLGVAKASLVGWSDGGEIALKLAIEHPERVARLFVFGTNYDMNGSKPRGSHHSRTFAAYAAKSRADYMRMSKTPGQFDELVDWLLPVWRNPMGFTKEQLRAIQVPTLVGDGDHDEVIVLAQVEEMAQLIPHAKLAVLKDTSHFALWQDPADFNQVLLDFLGE